MKKKHNKILGPWMILTLILLITANIIMGIVLMMQSRQAMRILIEQHMLDISNSAASLLDGDAVADLSADDKQTPEYQQALRILRTFQNNIGLEYIYGIHNDGNEHFSFTIDPSDDPGDFGEKIETTEALINASKGTADVDDTPYEDRWGRFYSSYSPIYDSQGNIVGIVGVDFDAEWFDSQVSKHLFTIIVVCSVSTLAGIVISFAVSARLRRRFKALYSEMDSLRDSFEGLGKLIKYDNYAPSSDKSKSFTSDFFAANSVPDSERDDEVSAIGNQIKSFQNELQHYLTYVHSQAYTDAMTGVSSKTAYLAKVNQLDKLISEKKAVFAVAVFDINGLKTVNDNFGHGLGDELIIAAADLLKQVFGAGAVFRIGGDEFIAVLENCPADDIVTRFKQFDELLNSYNSINGSICPLALSMSKGSAVFDPDSDTEYRTVFKLADQAMYRDKEEYYRRKSEERND